MTPSEQEYFDRVADRIERHFDAKVVALQALAKAELELHAATCPVKAEVDDAKSQAKGRKAVWVLVIGGAGFLGSIVGPWAKDAIAGLFH